MYVYASSTSSCGARVARSRQIFFKRSKIAKTFALRSKLKIPKTRRLASCLAAKTSFGGKNRPKGQKPSKFSVSQNHRGGLWQIGCLFSSFTLVSSRFKAPPRNVLSYQRGVFLIQRIRLQKELIENRSLLDTQGQIVCRG